VSNGLGLASLDRRQHDGAVPRSTTAHGRTGRPPRTSLPEILAAAHHVIDQDGWEKLTIRRLAADLGVGATTLYHHVRDREDLLVQLVNDVAKQIPRPDRVADDPRERIIAVVAGLHDTLAAWPWAAEVLTVDGFLGRLEEPGLWTVETVLDAAIEHGCTPTQAVDVFRNIWYYTVGEILVRARSARRRAENERPVYGDTFLGDVDLSGLPRLAHIGAQWPVLAARDIYPRGLRAVVTGLLDSATVETP
jgi:AcrR family transcriptional regulator